MKTLIVFMSSHGTTRKVVGLLAERLGTADTIAVNLAERDAPPLAGFDRILVGGSIHVGQIQKKIRHFLGEHRAELLAKPLGLFLCFMDKEHGRQEFDNAFPEDLRKHALACGLFGGELLFEEMNFLERFMIKKVSGQKESVSRLDNGAIEQFISSLQSA